MAYVGLDSQGWGGDDGAWGALYPNPDVKGTAQPDIVDYSQGWPISITGNKRRTTDILDDELKAFQQTHPARPNVQDMPRQAPVGMLGIEPTAGTMPGGVGGNPIPPPPAPPALPPPIDVAPPPQVASVPAVAPVPASPVSAPGSTDLSAQSRGTPPGAPGMPAAGEGPGLLQRFDQFTQRNPSTLLALAAGFAGAPSFGTGMSRAFGGAAQGAQLDYKNNLQTSQMGNTYRALLKAGVPQHVALAATQNPEIMKKVAEDYLADTKWETKTIKSKDAFGSETERLVAINPKTQEIKELTNRSAGAPGAGGVAPGGAPGMYAKGVNGENFNHNAVGDDYLKQFSPETQAGVRAYMKGNSLPTGRQQDVQMIKRIAQKYGEDIGMDASDTAHQQRKEWGVSVANTKNGVGLQARGFQQGLEHMKSLSDTLVKRGNVNGLGWEPLATTVNAVKNTTAANTSLSNTIDSKAQALAGEAGKLFSGQSGGGVHEREAMKQNLGKLNASSIAAAGGIEAMLDLMEGSLSTLEQRRDQLFPRGDAPQGSQFKTKHEEKLIEDIKKNIAILKGEQKAEAEAPAKPPILSGTAGPKNVPWKFH